MEEPRLPFDPPRHSPRRAANHQQAGHQQATALSHPPSRAEVKALALRLEEGLARGGSGGELEQLWQGVELELVRQVCLHCAERGELMETVRRQREAQAALMKRQVAAQRLELQQLRKDVGALGMVGVAAAESAEASLSLSLSLCLPSAPEPQPSKGLRGLRGLVGAESARQRRVRLLSHASCALSPGDQLEMLSSLASSCAVGQRGELLRTLLDNDGGGAGETAF